MGADDEIEGIRRRLAAGLQAGLSIGFTVEAKSDLWQKPTRNGELPLVVRRGVTIREVSLVQWPAYEAVG